MHALIALALAATCPTDAVVGVAETPGFTCQLQDKTFSDFTLSGVPADARIQFGQLGPLFAVTLSRDGSFFPTGRTVFDYTIAAAAPQHILGASVGVDVSFPPVTMLATFNGMALPPITNGQTELIAFNPGVGTVLVDNTALISGDAELNSITDDFAQVAIGIPEPGDLALFAGGLLGLAWVWRRRR
jgi:hypothetical protein